MPILLLVLLEVGLRTIGSGYPTHFLLPTSDGSRELLVQNNQFGWRFFGPPMARTPAPIAIARSKPPETIRIFVFGESAAYGDPQPRFGLARMLEALLSLRHPGLRFEVINAAMTGINSHAILPIARDCAGAGGDVWVLYMGHNEVVGPFGAGTVFGAQTPPLWLIRARLAWLTTRSGQAFDALLGRGQKPPLDKSEWGGMKMFVDHPVASDDPHLRKVYRHFGRNLADIIETGRRGGAAVIVSTVAANLKDCAPFASIHQAKLFGGERARWDELFAKGVAAENAGQFQAATVTFAELGRLDDQMAELHFRLARCALALGDFSQAQQHFERARDADALRFRCDRPMNQLIRQASSGRENERVFLADAEQTFAQGSAHGLPGQDLFYDHVHLTFEGNYLAARTIAVQVEKALGSRLPEKVSAQPWPALVDCAQRLAWNDWSRQAAFSDMFRRLQDPPFTGQINHDGQIQALSAQLQLLVSATHPAGIAAARRTCHAAAQQQPDDPWLQAQLTALSLEAGDPAAAAVAAERWVHLLPSSSEGWSQLGLALVQQQQYGPAVAAFQRACQWNAQDVWALVNLGQALAKEGQREEALRQFQRALDLKPRFGLAWLAEGQLLESVGRKSEAEACYKRAVANPILRPAELSTLARFCQSRGWFDPAAGFYAQALSRSGPNAMLQLEAGQCLAALGRHADALARYRDAVGIAPELAQARFLYGLELGRHGDPGAASAQFAEAVRLRPDLLEARANLGIALMNQGQTAEALAQFEEILRRNPTNALAARYAGQLRNGR